MGKRGPRGPYSGEGQLFSVKSANWQRKKSEREKKEISQIQLKQMIEKIRWLCSSHLTLRTNMICSKSWMRMEMKQPGMAKKCLKNVCLFQCFLFKFYKIYVGFSIKWFKARYIILGLLLNNNKKNKFIFNPFFRIISRKNNLVLRLMDLLITKMTKQRSWRYKQYTQKENFMWL